MLYFTDWVQKYKKKIWEKSFDSMNILSYNTLKEKKLTHKQKLK
jgi:hypothetical protein